MSQCSPVSESSAKVQMNQTQKRGCSISKIDHDYQKRFYSPQESISSLPGAKQKRLFPFLQYKDDHNQSFQCRDNCKVRSHLIKFSSLCVTCKDNRPSHSAYLQCPENKFHSKDFQAIHLKMVEASPVWAQ